MRVIVSCSGKFHAFNLVEQLEKNGIDVVFFTSYSSISNSLLKYIVKRQDNENIRRSTFRTNAFLACCIKIFRSNPQFVNDLFDNWVAKKIKNIEANVFIGWSGMSLNSIKIARSKGMRTILERGSTHVSFQKDILEAEYKLRGKLFNIQKSTISKELSEYRLVDLIVIPSKFVERTFTEKGFEKTNLFVNHFGAGEYFKKRENIIDSKFRILYLGTFSIRKGAYYLCEAIEQLSNLDIEIWIIGKVDKDVSSLYNKIVNYRNIKFFGFVNHYELSDLIGQCSFAIHPSLEEGQSMVINQIMKVGLPFIATPNSGAEEIVRHLENGIIIEPGSVSAIVEAVTYFYEDRSRLFEMTRNVESMQINENSWDAYGDRYCKLLNE